MISLEIVPVIYDCIYQNRTETVDGRVITTIICNLVERTPSLRVLILKLDTSEQAYRILSSFPQNTMLKHLSLMTLEEASPEVISLAEDFCKNKIGLEILLNCTYPLFDSELKQGISEKRVYSISEPE